MPTLDKNGLPRKGQFLANDAKTIYGYFHSESIKIANYIYVIMARPMQDASPSFVLCTFAQPNFTHLDCTKRIKFIKRALADKGIQLLGWSGDGDSRILKAMKNFSKINNAQNTPKVFKEFINADLSSDVCCIQDELHVLNKLKNKLHHPSIPIVMGYNDTAHISDLYILDQKNLKSKTKLCRSDLYNIDRMSSNQALKICNSSVQNTLNDLYPETKAGIKLYLRVMSDHHDAFSDKKLSPSERIYKIFFSLFIFRSIKSHHGKFRKAMKDFTSNNFITSNTFNCIEVNAINLLMVARKLRDTNQEHCFLPWLMNSQTCESHFRTLRSCTPNQSTQTNFYGSEGQSRMRKLQTLSDLTVYLVNDGKFF